MSSLTQDEAPEGILPDETPVPVEPATPGQTRLKRWTKLLATFFAGQSLVQALNLVTGFLLLRWMTTEAYAQYSVAFAFQSTLNTLVDLGFSGSIVALVGERGHDKAVVGEYIRCARHFRSKMFLILAVVSAVAFPLVTWNQPWDWRIKASLWASLIASVYFQGKMLYSAPLLIHRRLREYYRAGIIPAGFRLVSAGALEIFHAVFGWAASWLNAASFAIQGSLYRKHSHDLVEEPKAHSKEVAVEMRKYLAPLWPGMIFYAFQGQITVGLISIFGKTQNIAEVAALGRLSQLFMILGAMNGVLIEPLIARTHFKKLPLRIGQIFSVLTLLTASIWIFSLLYPTPLAWLMGPKYSNAFPQIPMIILVAGIGYLTSVLFMINAARKWIDWLASASQMAFVIVAQVSALLLLDLSSTHGVIMFSLVTSIAAFTVVALVSGRGLMKFNKGSEDKTTA